LGNLDNNIVNVIFEKNELPDHYQQITDINSLKLSYIELSKKYMKMN